jgi:phosphoribosyl 1,2-cyclic phosphodiesterase
MGHENFFLIHSAHDYERKLDETLAGQMERAYFPVKLDQMGARMTFHELVPGESEHSGVRIGVNYLHHTMLTLGYRLSHEAQKLVFACDNEPRGVSTALGQQFWAALEAPRWESCVVHPEDRRFASEFASGVDLLIHDAQYTAAEYRTKVGWGHSPLEYAVDLAIHAGVRRLALFHHDPQRDDAGVDRMVALAQARVEAAGAAVQVFGAAESLELDLGERSPVAPLASQATPESLAD